MSETQRVGEGCGEGKGATRILWLCVDFAIVVVAVVEVVVIAGVGWMLFVS